MAVEWEIKRFNALSLYELYDLLKLRSDVFIVEQNCVYPDIDDKDQKALHLTGKFEGQIVGCARLFGPGDYFDDASIGRVVIHQDLRDRKWGHDLMVEAIAGIRKHFNVNRVTISAQLYLKKFY